MTLLYYWRPDNYRRDLDLGAGYHLSQGNPMLHSIDTGDSVWAFTRAADGRYVMAAELAVRAKTINPPDFRYGKYRVWGDLNRSRYLRVAGQPSLEELIRSVSGRTEARILARAFQGHAAVRTIDAPSHDLLRAACQDLPLEPRARILPEERLEAELLLGDPAAVERLLVEEPAGIAEQRRRYLYQLAQTRSERLARQLQELYEGKCQLCLWHPNHLYCQPLCEAHHIVWLSRGGSDDLSNLILLCPNHHRAVHRCDAPLDWSDLSFDFGNGHRELVQSDHHLAA